MNEEVVQCLKIVTVANENCKEPSCTPLNWSVTIKNAYIGSDWQRVYSHAVYIGAAKKITYACKEQ